MMLHSARYAYCPLVAAVFTTTATLSTADARPSVKPYLEVGQVMTADLGKGGDVLTYSTVAAGIDVSATGRRSEIQASYRYEHRFGWKDELDQSGVHNGILRARYDVVPQNLSLEAGALATRARTDLRGDAPGNLLGNVRNISQIYSVYAGPSFRAAMRDLEVEAAYRLGYTRSESKDKITILPGWPSLGVFDESLSQMASANFGMAPGPLPFGWRASLGFSQDNAGLLDQRYRQFHGRGDVTLPVRPTIALVGGIGYENIESSNRAAKFDAGGTMLTDKWGRPLTDDSAPRTLNYDFDGVYWDAGVLWQPSRRTSLEARVGQRYGTMSYQGSFNWQVNDYAGFQASVYDQVETFGQELTGGLSRLPTQFRTSNIRDLGLGNTCAFGTAGAGGCLNGALGSLNNGVYRSRGGNLMWTAARGRSSFGLGGGYNRRSFLAPVGNGKFVTEQSWYAQSTLGYALSRATSFDADLTVSLYDPGIGDVGTILAGSVSSGITHRFTRNLDARASVFLSATQLDPEDDVFASALASLRYSF